MIIIVGLGNPGTEYEKTRHNVGFMAVDFFVKKNELGDFTDSKKHNAEILKSGKILLAKPQTFMNKSGISVNKLLNNCHCEERSSEAISSYNGAK